MNNEQKREMHWELKDRLDELDSGCFDCENIDCGGSYIHKMLEKKHRVDVIDRKACKKQKKERADKLRKIIYSPFFKQQRLDPCHHCKKKVEKDGMVFGVVSKDYKGSSVVDNFCKLCAKKYKIKTLWKRK